MDMNNIIGKENRNTWMGIAIVLIYFYHLILFSNNTYSLNISLLNWLFMKGNIGVDIFLFLSSIGLCYSYTNNSLLSFYLRRIKRIYPLYLLFLIIIILLFHPCGHEIIKPMLMQCSGLAILSPFQHYCIEWYIPTLILLYLLFPLLFLFYRNIHVKKGLYLEVLIILILCYCTPILELKILDRCVERIPIICIGIISYFYLQNNDIKRLAYFYLLCCILTLIVDRNMLNFSLIIPIVLYEFDKQNIKIPFNKYFKFIGKHTLEIYLAQVITTKYFIRYHLFENVWLTFLISILLTVLTAIIFHLFQKYSLLILSFNNNTLKK